MDKKQIIIAFIIFTLGFLTTQMTDLLAHLFNK